MCNNYKPQFIGYLSAVLHIKNDKSHTRTVARECFKGDEASQWKRPKFDPSPC